MFGRYLSFRIEASSGIWKCRGGGKRIPGSDPSLADLNVVSISHWKDNAPITLDGMYEIRSELLPDN